VKRSRWQSQNLYEDLGSMTDQDLWERHNTNRADLIKYVNHTTGSTLRSDLLTVVWARRFASYKRPMLLFSDLARIKHLMTRQNLGFQVVVAGNASEGDTEGAHARAEIGGYTQDPAFGGRLVYLQHYAPEVSLHLVMGADLWLNTPVRGMEACGTSGMKAGLNGALQLSISDGWVDEVDLTQIGWEIPVEKSADALYSLFENEVAPLFYSRDARGIPVNWLTKMRHVINLTESQFTTDRMLMDYRKKLYL
jgi:starch phosphorylase